MKHLRLVPVKRTGPQFQPPVTIFICNRRKEQPLYGNAAFSNFNLCGALFPSSIIFLPVATVALQNFRAVTQDI